MPGAHFAESPEEELQPHGPVEYPSDGMVMINYLGQEVEGSTDGEDTDTMTQKTQEMCRRLARRNRQRQERAEQEQQLEAERQQQEEKDRAAAQLTRDAERAHLANAEQLFARRMEVHEQGTKEKEARAEKAMAIYNALAKQWEDHKAAAEAKNKELQAEAKHLEALREMSAKDEEQALAESIRETNEKVEANNAP